MGTINSYGQNVFSVTPQQQDEADSDPHAQENKNTARENANYVITPIGSLMLLFGLYFVATRNSICTRLHLVIFRGIEYLVRSFLLPYLMNSIKYQEEHVEFAHRKISSYHVQSQSHFFPSRQMERSFQCPHAY